MFSGFCNTIGRNVLFDTSSIRSFENTGDGPVFTYECSCGSEGIYIAHGVAGSSAAGHADLVTV